MELDDNDDLVTEWKELEPIIDVEYIENLMHEMCDDDLIYLSTVLNTLLRNN